MNLTRELPHLNLKHVPRSSVKVWTTFVALLLLAMPSVLWAQSQQLADPADYFQVLSPAANSTVKGNVSSSWTIFDNNAANVPYQLKLMSNNCLNEVATISAGTAPSSMSTNFGITWPSSGPLQGASSIADGDYCVQLCVSLLNGGSPYSSCNLRVITIRNRNSAPQFTSVPATTVNLGITEPWSFALKAVDPDGDPISFRFGSTAPGFLSINAATGLLSTNSVTRSAGTYTVAVAVQDNQGGVSSYTFNIVIAPAPTPPNGGNQPPVDPGKDELELEFVSPILGQVFTGTTNMISWTVSGDSVDVAKLTKVSLYYANILDPQEFILIAELPATAESYVWDVTDLEEGTYYLKAQLDLQGSESQNFYSSQFKITTEGGEQPILLPMIVDVLPQNLSEITELRPRISGRFTPVPQSEVDPASFELILDGEDITDLCDIDRDGFVCELQTDLGLGAHKLEASILDSEQRQGSLEWVFVIKSQDADPSPTPDDGAGRFLAQNTLAIIALVCCLALILLLVPWILYTMWLRRNSDDNGGNNSEQVNVMYDQPEEIDPAQFTSYEDYFSATTNQGVPATTVNYYVPEPQSQPAYSQPEVVASTTVAQPAVSTPDYADFYKSVDSNQEQSMDINSNNGSSSSPSWLTPVADSVTTEPLQPARQEDLDGFKQDTPTTPTPNGDPLPPSKDSKLGTYGYGSKQDID